VEGRYSEGRYEEAGIREEFDCGPAGKEAQRDAKAVSSLVLLNC
jgi:hypothetical protein